MAGGWSFALSDYLQQGCMGFLNKPEFLDMAAIVDPYTYRYRQDSEPPGSHREVAPAVTSKCSHCRRLAQGPSDDAQDDSHCLR